MNPWSEDPTIAHKNLNILDNFYNLFYAIDLPPVCFTDALEQKYILVHLAFIENRELNYLKGYCFLREGIVNINACLI